MLAELKKYNADAGENVSYSNNKSSELRIILDAKGRIPHRKKRIFRQRVFKKSMQKHYRNYRLDYKTLFESVNDAIIIIDPFKRIIIAANNKAVKLYGFKKEEFIGMSLNKLSKDADKSEMQIKQLLNTGENKNFESIQYNSRGEELNMLINSSIINYQGKIAVLSINRDITELKQAENNSKSVHLMCNSLIENSPLAIMVVDLNGLVEVWNPAAEKLFGWKKEEVIGKLYPIIPFGKEKEAIELFVRCINGGGLADIETTRARKDGSAVEITRSFALIQGPDGKGKRMLIIMNDITERKKFETELIKEKIKAQESDRMKSEFLAQISHEIRTPINAILSFISLIKEEVADKISDDLNTGFDIIDRNSQRLIRTIDLILNMSQVKNGSFDLQFQPTDLVSDILAPIVNQFSSSAKVKNLSLSLENHLTHQRTNIDNYTVSQIFINLIDNAIKYTNKGEVKISVYTNSSEKVCVDISDTGIGISNEYLNKIFKPFSQEDTGYTRKYDGTGLGLALVKKYCEMNYAEIKVKSEKGNGSVFSVIFN
jgi:PAS domain S-box-containing protein